MQGPIRPLLSGPLEDGGNSVVSADNRSITGNLFVRTASGGDGKTTMLLTCYLWVVDGLCCRSAQYAHIVPVSIKRVLERVD